MSLSTVEAAVSSQSNLSAMRFDYNRYSRGQNQVLDQFKSFLDTAIAAHSSFELPGIPNASSQRPFLIADFGCSTGLNSSDALSFVINGVRQRYGIDRCPSLLVVLNDLPTNCWGELFTFLQEDERSFLQRHAGVFSVSSGRNFYEQVLPDNSLQLGISSVSLQWCSQLPVKMADHCISTFATEIERESFKRQAAADWTRFMKARARELVKGGVIAVNCVTSLETADGLYNEIYNAAKTLLERGTICTEELGNLNYRMHFRSLEEVSNRAIYEPFGLELLVAERFPPTLSVYYQNFLQHRDAGRFALDCSNVMSAACEPSFLDALSVSKSDDEKRMICSELWKEYRSRISKHPENVSHLWGIIAVVVKKK